VENGVNNVCRVIELEVVEIYYKNKLELVLKVFFFNVIILLPVQKVKFSHKFQHISNLGLLKLDPLKSHWTP